MHGLPVPELKSQRLRSFIERWQQSFVESDDKSMCYLYISHQFLGLFRRQTHEAIPRSWSSE